MMVFTTPSFKSNRHSTLQLLCWAFCLTLLTWALVLFSIGHAQAQGRDGTQVTSFKLERTTDGVYVSAQVQFELPQAVEDALLKGIPIFFVTQSELLQERWYWYDRTVALAQRSMRLSYQPLTRRWRLNVSQGLPNEMSQSQALSQNFDSLDDALSAIRRISRWRVAEAVPPESDARIDVLFSFRLDLDKLPRPFQIGNFGQADWVIAASAKGTVPAEISK